MSDITNTPATHDDSYEARRKARDAAAVAERVEDFADRLRCVQFRGDDAKGWIASELVKETVKQLYTRKYPEFVWAQGEYIKFNRSGNPGMQTREWFEEDGVAEADWIDDVGDGAGTADYSIKPHLNHFARFGIKIRVTDEDVARAQMQGLFSIAEKKASMAKRGYMQKLNKIVLLGDQSKQISGARELPGAYRLALSNSWDTRGPEDLVADLVSVFATIFNGSQTVLKPNRVVFPSQLLLRLNTVQQSAFGPMTIMQWLKQIFGPGTDFPIANWSFEQSLNTAADGGGRAMLVYNDGSEYLEALLPVDFKPARAQQFALHMEQMWFGKFGGIANYQPRAGALVSGF